MGNSQFKPPSVLRQRRRRRLLGLIAVLAGSLLLAVGFWLGHQAAFSGMGLDPLTYQQMQRELPAAQARAQESERALEMERTRHEVNRRALEMVRSDLATQKEQIASLEEGLRFYRSLMVPGEIAQGLSLRELELIAGPDPERFGFRIVAQQEAVKHQLLKGKLQVEVFGRQGGEERSYSLSELSADVEGDSMPLRFRYFQALEGELTLPEGFEPEGVKLVATATTPREAQVEQTYSWDVKERFTHVGK